MSSSVASRRPKRLATDVIGQLEDQLKVNDRDIGSWLTLIQHVIAKDKTEQVRAIYEQCLKIFPFLERIWIGYIQYELNRGEFDKVEELFKRCLFQSTGVALWQCYVGYIRRKNNLITGGEEARRVIFQAYDLAVSKVGQDPLSGSLWEEYIQFIDDWKPGSSWDEQPKFDLKRKVLKRALTIPLGNLEKLWTIYTTFENDLNVTTARKFIADISGAYMNARSLYKESSKFLDTIDRSDDIIPEGVYSPQQLKAWKGWISWEKLNRLELDNTQLLERIDYIYQQAIQKLIFHPEIWFDMADFYKQNPQYFSSTKLQDLLRVSLLVNPGAFSLNFKLIDLYELDDNSAQLTKTFDSLLEFLNHNYSQLLEQEEDLKAIALEDYINLKQSQDEDGDGPDAKPISEEEKESIYKANPGIKAIRLQMQKLSKTVSLTYCTYMHTLKRMRGIEAARPIFKASRASKAKTHHIFTEAALMEYRHEPTKKIALKVFELGLRPSNFPNDGELIYKYLQFLMRTQDDINVRTVFETTLKKPIEQEWMQKLFKLMVRFESSTGSLESVVRLEEKYRELFPEEDAIGLFADRYSFNESAIFDPEVDLIRYNDLKLRNLTGSEGKRSFAQIEEEREGLNNAENKEDESRKKQHVESEDTGNDVEPQSVVKPVSQGEFVTDEIYNLLRVLPNSASIGEPLFNSSKLIALLKGLE